MWKFWRRRRRDLPDRPPLAVHTDDSAGVEVKKELREALHDQASRVHWLEWEAERLRVLGWQADVEGRRPNTPDRESS